MTKKLNTRLHALKALLFWSIRLLAIHFLLLWMKVMDSLAALKDRVLAIASEFFVRVKSKLPSVSLFAIKALLVWMKFKSRVTTLKERPHTMVSQLLSKVKTKLPSARLAGMKALLMWMKFTQKMRGLKAYLSSIFPRLLARLKRISLRGFFKSLLSRYLLYLILINAVPLFALGWIYFGTLVVPASVHSIHSSSWWIIFQWVVIVLSVVHGVFSVVLLRMKKITQGYFFSLLVTVSPFLYAYVGYARHVNGFSVSGTLQAFIPFLIAYSKIILGMIS
ncbi:hypothetical protein [Chryseolinea soli]|uniref:Uncharacterized protein n=1 Tax=Chryseolinea soli TaxID=2321403 RepID=A0A385SEV3_9BACT|nr:hypothetical protein [Chryseolinea soli]AYB29432.1 hypothetical protein D4L85_02015 [Chryseolinea soli]